MAELSQIAAQVAHQVDLQKLANSIAVDQNAALNELSKTIRDVLADYEYIDTKKLYNEIIKEITKEVNASTLVITDSVQDQLFEAIKEEVTFQYSVLKAVSSKRPLRPGLDKINSAILNKPLVLNGKAMTWEERIGAYQSNTLTSIKQRIMAGWANGEPVADITRSITGGKNVTGIIDRSKSSTNALVKDLLSHSSSMVKAETARQNGDIIIGERAIVTLDSRTSPICQYIGSQDGYGKVFLYAEVGRNFERSPFHWACRTVMIFVIAPEYDIGTQGQTRPAVVNGKAIQVPLNTGWYDLAKEYKSVAEQALGESRAHLLDNMSAKEFNRIAHNSLGEAITLEQMKNNSKKVASLLKD
jgi:hypothetical protein